MNNLKVTVKILILVATSIVGMLFVGYRGYSSIDKAAVELYSFMPGSSRA